LSIFSNNIFGLSLVDNIDHIDKKFELSPVVETANIQSLVSNDNFIINNYTQDFWDNQTFKSNYKYVISKGMIQEFNIDEEYQRTIKKPSIKDWNNYVLKDDYKYLINENILHEFNIDGEYKRTIKQSYVTDDEQDYTYSYESRYIDVLESEKERYIKSGFTDIPSLHVSTIQDDISYFNQLENSIKPKASCVPTAVSMFLHMQGNKELVPDDISQRIQFDSNGSTTKDVLESLSHAYNIKGRVYDWGFSLNSIKEHINKGTPVISYIKSGYVNYYHLFENETYYDRKDRRYYVKNSAVDINSHAILITGYLEIEDTTYLEIYDPISKSSLLVDDISIPNGKGKFMTYEEFKRINNGPIIQFEVGPYKLK